MFLSLSIFSSSALYDKNNIHMTDLHTEKNPIYQEQTSTKQEQSNKQNILHSSQKEFRKHKFISTK